MSMRFVKTRGAEGFSPFFRRRNVPEGRTNLVTLHKLLASRCRVLCGEAAPQGGAKEQSTYTLTGLEVNLRVEEKSYVSFYSHQKGMAILIVHADCRVGSSAAIDEQRAREESFHISDSGGEASKQTHNLTHFADWRMKLKKRFVLKGNRKNRVCRNFECEEM